MSLGRSYGQAEDDATVAVDNVVRAGVVVVASAGNSADRPFIAGCRRRRSGPSAWLRPRCPTTRCTRSRSTPRPYRGSRQPHPKRPAAVLVAGPDEPLRPDWPSRRATGRAARPPPSAGFPAGAIALVKRGTCYASLKAQNAQAAGAVSGDHLEQRAGRPAGLLLRRRAPVTVPTLTISLATASRLSTAVAAGAGARVDRPGRDHVADQHHGRHVQPRSVDLRHRGPSRTSAPPGHGCPPRSAPATGRPTSVAPRARPRS